jgi:hypothetical protein
MEAGVFIYLCNKAIVGYIFPSFAGVNGAKLPVVCGCEDSFRGKHFPVGYLSRLDERDDLIELWGVAIGRVHLERRDR